MKILLVVTDAWYFRSHRLPLARKLREQGWEVGLATDPGEQRVALEAEGLRIFPLRFARSVLGQPANAQCLVRLVRVYRRFAPDLVHHVSFLPILYGSLAARATGVPAVVNAVTGLGNAFSASRPFLRALLERAYAMALARSHVLFQNPDDQEYFRARGLLGKAPSTLLAGSGVDTTRFAPTPEPHGVPVVLLHARMLWSKGVGVLVEASQILRARGLAHTVVLAGAPHASNPEAIPTSELERWHAQGLVRWLGHVSDVPALLRQATLVALPSHYREGVPLALLEGAAAGRALVTTDTPGCREVVQHGVNGLLVPPRDPRALADALATLLADPERRARMGRASRRLAEERFSTEVVNGAIVALYRALAAGRFPAAGVAAELESAPRG